MSYKKQLRGVAQYVRGSAEASVLEASPHQLIDMLYKSLLGRLAAAKGAIQRADTILATQSINRAQSILIELRTSIDFEKGGEVVQSLDALYEYCGRKLVDGMASNNPEMIDEVINLIKPIAEAWSAIKKEAEEILAKRETEEG